MDANEPSPSRSSLRGLPSGYFKIGQAVGRRNRRSRAGNKQQPPMSSRYGGGGLNSPKRFPESSKAGLGSWSLMPTVMTRARTGSRHLWPRGPAAGRNLSTQRPSPPEAESILQAICSETRRADFPRAFVDQSHEINGPCEVRLTQAKRGNELKIRGSGNLCQKPDRRKGIVGPDSPEDARNSIERPSLLPKLQAVSDKRENECRVTQNRWKDFPIFQRT
jgi:hypothetical protein